MRTLAAVLYAAFGSSLVGLCLAMAVGRLTPTIAIVSLIIGLTIGLFGLYSSDRKPRPDATTGNTEAEKISPWEWAAVIAFSLFALRAFLWVTFIQGDDIRVLSPNNLGDISIHITFIEQFASGQRFWPESPIFAGAQLAYPIGADFFNSLLRLVGVNSIPGLVWVGLAGSALTGIALWRWGRGFALAAFLFNGGLMAWRIFQEERLVDFQDQAAWKSIPLALFVTQRGLLFALPAGLALLCSWRTRFFGEHPDKWSMPLWGEVLLYSTMPLFHFHTFLFLSMLLGIWFVVHRPARRELAYLVGISFVPASSLVFLVTGMFSSASALGLNPGWMQGNESFLVFWGMNFGFLPLFVGALVVSLVLQNRDAKSGRWPLAIVIPSLLMFGICCFVRFAPWEWDNTKLMIWSYLAIIPVLWDCLIVRFPPVMRLVSCVALFASGLFSLMGGIDSNPRGFPIAKRSELDGVAVAVRQLPLEATFAAAPNYNHPLLLNGRKLAMGYDGHVWSHGYPWHQRKTEVTNIMEGQPGWLETAKRLNCNYLFWGPQESAMFPNSTQPWREQCPRILSGPWGDIYDLSQAH